MYPSGHIEYIERLSYRNMPSGIDVTTETNRQMMPKRDHQIKRLVCRYILVQWRGISLLPRRPPMGEDFLKVVEEI